MTATVAPVEIPVRFDFDGLAPSVSAAVMSLHKATATAELPAAGAVPATDVRDGDEQTAGYIRGATRIPPDSLNPALADIFLSNVENSSWYSYFERRR
jgi:hypothetical protein